jgi:acetylornithine/succinyldiaminopimelate/putrescine aminotransferase
LLSAIAGFVMLRLTPPVAISADDIDEAQELFGADQPD